MAAEPKNIDKNTGNSNRGADDGRIDRERNHVDGDIPPSAASVPASTPLAVPDAPSSHKKKKEGVDVKSRSLEKTPTGTPSKEPPAQSSSSKSKVAVTNAPPTPGVASSFLLETLLSEFISYAEVKVNDVGSLVLVCDS